MEMNVDILKKLLRAADEEAEKKGAYVKFVRLVKSDTIEVSIIYPNACGNSAGDCFQYGNNGDCMGCWYAKCEWIKVSLPK